MYYTTVPTLSLEQKIPALEIARNISFLLTILELYNEITVPREPFEIEHMYIYILVGNDSVNKFPRKFTRAIERPLLDNRAVNTPP
jgi:hypothetical protein